MKRFLQWISVPIGLWLLGFAIDEFKMKWFNKRIGALIWCVLIWMFFYVRIHKDRWVGVGLAVLMVVACYVLPLTRFYGEPVTMQAADRIANLGVGRGLGHYYAKQIPVFWNPYLFGGLPSFGALQSYYCAPVYGMFVLLSLLQHAFPVVYLYGVLRLHPGSFERKIIRFRFLKNDSDNIIIWGVVFFVLALAYALIKGYAWLGNM